ncbi:SHOCT domain-containing protein [Mesoterricola silvestris]|uniref:SHOCT domain-containing protein n=1 Tax=Mesoterricola silvestris TaxID=2927979 RepID=A0AA48K9L1_9BACT|nr:SHOCT domain-containing protein [Mesoterricola silvestris]BDU72442.1 hypothetical protein METEAL_16160 [Mesoterricola silvestris]
MKVLAGLPVLCAVAALAAAPHRTNWELKEFTWVKLVPAEGGAAPSQHPVALDAEALRRNLRALRFEEGALFEAKEVDQLVKPLLEAFAVADPGEDLVLLSTGRRGGGFLNPAFGVTARLFVEGGKVQMIVRDARLDFVDRFRVRGDKPEFTYGSRTDAGKAAITGEGLASRRADWVEFPAVPYAAPAPVLPGFQGAAEPRAAPAEGPEARLRALKRLRDENLITEDEYQKKRQEILKSL